MNISHAPSSVRLLHRCVRRVVDRCIVRCPAAISRTSASIRYPASLHGVVEYCLVGSAGMVDVQPRSTPTTQCSSGIDADISHVPASTATAGLFDFKKPAYKPVCTKGCKADYDVCKPVEVEEEQCPKPVYVAPVYKGKYGRKLNNYKPKYTPAPTPAPVCKKVKVIKQQCTKAPCTVTELVDKTTCQLVCDAKTGRKLSNYKPKYTPAPVYVAPKPKCENVSMPQALHTCTPQHDYTDQ